MTIEGLLDIFENADEILDNDTELFITSEHNDCSYTLERVFLEFNAGKKKWEVIFQLG